MNIPSAITDPTKRYDFILLFDVKDGNPNGDPDAGNLPRVDPETLQGIVTDVCLKRKIRNFVDMAGQIADPEYDGDGLSTTKLTSNQSAIFVRDSGVALNTKIASAAKAADNDVEKNKKKENPNSRKEMCRRYYDVRMFGGVLSTGDYNSGQVRGPMQLTFARSVDPIVPSEIAITRVAITKEGEQKETEMGRKAFVPYGLYLGKGFYSPMLGSADKNGTGVSQEDLELFWNAILMMFENDRSAARGHMQLRRAYIFVHENALGNAPSGTLFSCIKVTKNIDHPRDFSHYDIQICEADLPSGVKLVKLLG
ncbi:MAG: type I-C CRISPR-associated protein Cas7/Csd2 [Armatimonadota bacterium]